MVARGHVKSGVVVLDDGVRLPEGQKVTVLTQEASPSGAFSPHSLMDILPVSLGPLLRTPTDEDDLLGEMLEGRR
jgi:hypothetical protein